MFPGKIDLYKTLFRGREDIFAQRWEKGGKASYSPQYDYDPYQYRLHKMNGGTIQNYADKQLRGHQKLAVAAAVKKDMGVIVARIASQSQRFHNAAKKSLFIQILILRLMIFHDPENVYICNSRFAIRELQIKTL